MERSIRIGKDFNVRWSINKVVDGERQPYELAGKELVLQYRTPYGLKEATEWKVVGNTIVWTFRGKEQKALGSYELILTENGGKDGMVTVDTCRAFKLVAHSCEETEGSGSDIVIEDVVLESEVAFAALRGPQGERGPSYDDTEIKGKLAELSEENERLKERIEEQDQFIEDLQNTKIEKENDDYYPKMAVGLADNLAGVDVVDSEINFRRSGGGAITDGVARIESIKGNSVVWNQLHNRTPFTSNGITTTIDGNTTIINGVTTASFFGIKAGVRVSANKMLMVVQCLANPDGLSFNVADLNSAMAGIDVTASAPNGYAFYTGTYRANGNTLGIQKFGDVGTAFNNVKIVVSLYDLTKKFGAGYEPNTIEEFYQRDPMGVDLNAYNEGEVIHMDVQSIESQGVNAWDEVLASGRINSSDGEVDTAYNTQAHSPNFIRIIGGASYYARVGNVPGTNYYVYLYAYFYDENLAYIGAYGNSIRNATFSTPTNAKYMRINLYSSISTGIPHDYKGVCINLSDTAINGKYFPYIKRVEDLSIIRKYFPQGMKSAGSAHDEIRYNKESGKWEKVQRIGEAKMKDLTWLMNQTSQFYATLPVRPSGVGGVSSLNVLTLRYQPNDAYSQREGICTLAPRVWLYDKTCTDLASFLASLTDNDMLYYELAEPIVTELDEADQFKDLDYQVWNCGTEKAIAEGKSAPLAADITYGFNAIGKIKELESLVAALRAKVGICSVTR